MLNKGHLVTMGRDDSLRDFPSIPAAEQQTTGAAAAAAETLKDRDLTFDSRHPLTFRVTGAASVARLEPLLLNHHQEDRRKGIWHRALSSGGGGGNSPASNAQLDFVWETTVTKEQHQQHRNARVLNRLNGAQVPLSYLNEAPVLGRCSGHKCQCVEPPRTLPAKTASVPYVCSTQ